MTEQVMEVEGVESVEVGTLALLDGASSLVATDRAQIDVQIATAKQYPRSITRALREAEQLACMDEETAASMFYVLPRSGKKIEGPSARLAEIMLHTWGNIRADADIVAEDKAHVTAMGTAFDLERNVAVRVRVKRRITDRHGKRYNEDMIGVTSNAAISIALRNAVFKVVPRVFSERVYQAARKASIGEAGTLTQKRQSMLEWFQKAGVTDKQLFDALDVAGLDDIGEDELITLRGLATAIKDGETTVEQAFSSRAVESEATSELNQAIEDSAPQPEPAAPEEHTVASQSEAQAEPRGEKRMGGTTSGAPAPKGMVDSLQRLWGKVFERVDQPEGLKELVTEALADGADEQAVAAAHGELLAYMETIDQDRLRQQGAHNRQTGGPVR